ncbi:MAG TPA: DNA-3-methyladenine glycosylase [Smithellaceae bacterium]|nr:DNA-3-methyladenine glycosylase [Smithellaceae bacterium]HQM45263.1 DNA-3-methyladenine glycosylase [Smithellaceae bacterium]
MKISGVLHEMMVLERNFYHRNTLEVARDLLGKKLVRRFHESDLSGMIIETEAYCGQEDSACHAHRGKTQRNAVMFGPPGYSYVYFTYGMHYLLNLVTENEGNPCAVLIRAIIPLTGIAEMEARRKRRGKNLTNGPAKLCQALAIDRSFNGWDLTTGVQLWVENCQIIPADKILATPRIGIDYARREDREALWRFLISPV